MTYPVETKDKFVDLRASGTTLIKAAEELGMSYNTGANWEKDLKERIEASKAMRIEELQEKYRLTKERRIELYGEFLLAIKDELAERDLSDIPTPKLFDMLIKCTNALESEAQEPEFITEDEMEQRKMARITREEFDRIDIFRKTNKN